MHLMFSFTLWSVHVCNVHMQYLEPRISHEEFVISSRMLLMIRSNVYLILESCSGQEKHEDW